MRAAEAGLETHLHQTVCFPKRGEAEEAGQHHGGEKGARTPGSPPLLGPEGPQTHPTK